MITISYSRLSSSFGRSQLGQKVRSIVNERSKLPVVSPEPVEIDRHLFGSAIKLPDLLYMIGGSNEFAADQIAVGAVVTYHPSTQEISLIWVSGANDDVSYDKSRSIGPDGYHISDTISDYPEYVSYLDQLWQRVKRL